MMFSFRRTFFPTVEEQIKQTEHLLKIHNEFVPEHGCSTCDYCKRIDHSGYYVADEEYKCEMGLTCDSVASTVKNCLMWKDFGYLLEEKIERLKNELD